MRVCARVCARVCVLWWIAGVLQVIAELKLGVIAMACNVFATLLWMRYIDPLVWTYGYFDKHEYNIWWFLASIPL